jgi:hypothetical protein
VPVGCNIIGMQNQTKIGVRDIITLALIITFSVGLLFNINNNILNGLTSTVFGWYFGLRNKSLQSDSLTV